VLACVKEVEPRFFCRCLNTLPRAALFRFPRQKSIKDIEIALLPLEDQRQVLAALTDIETKTALLWNQNRVLNAMVQALFDHCFVFGGEKFRPLADFTAFHTAGSDRFPAPGASTVSNTDAGTAFYDIFLCPRKGPSSCLPAC
jgi:hypothetical protein